MAFSIIIDHLHFVPFVLLVTMQDKSFARIICLDNIEAGDFGFHSLVEGVLDHSGLLNLSSFNAVLSFDVGEELIPLQVVASPLYTDRSFEFSHRFARALSRRFCGLVLLKLQRAQEAVAATFALRPNTLPTNECLTVLHIAFEECLEGMGGLCARTTRVFFLRL